MDNCSRPFERLVDLSRLTFLCRLPGVRGRLAVTVTPVGHQGAVKTERWSMEYRFERPPRWDPARPERPAVVYLDQWCWDQLVRDRAGDLDGTPDAGIYELLKELAKQGHVVFPLSHAH